MEEKSPDYIISNLTKNLTIWKSLRKNLKIWKKIWSSENIWLKFWGSEKILNVWNFSEIRTFQNFSEISDQQIWCQVFFRCSELLRTLDFLSSCWWFLVPSVKFRHSMPAFQPFEYLICFWSYPAHDYTTMRPRTWPTWWSSSDKNQLSSHGDIQLTVQTFISLVTMQSTSLLACYSAIAADHNYTLLESQHLFQLPDTSWYILSLPAPPIPVVLGQHILLHSLPSPIFFGCLRSIVRLERSFLVVTVSPKPIAYGPCLLCPCQVFLPISFMMLPRVQWIQHTYLAHLLADDIHKCCHTPNVFGTVDIGIMSPVFWKLKSFFKNTFISLAHLELRKRKIADIIPHAGYYEF